MFTDEVTDNLPEPVKIFTKTSPSRMFTTEVVLKKLLQLKPYEAPGVDNLSSTTLREVTIAFPLSEMVVESKENGVPVNWKSINVTPIYKKKGMKSHTSNYRPVSLTSHVSKVTEAIIRDAIVDHLQNHDMIKSSQHGFRKGLSCLTNHLVHLNKVTSCIDEELAVDYIYLAFSKAFDRVSHHRLAITFNVHGLEGEMNR